MNNRRAETRKTLECCSAGLVRMNLTRLKLRLNRTLSSSCEDVCYEKTQIYHYIKNRNRNKFDIFDKLISNDAETGFTEFFLLKITFHTVNGFPLRL